MKQGRASVDNNVGTKREPIAHAINPGGVAQLGNHVAKNPEPLYAGRGFSSPAPKACVSHPSGSQGKHK